MKRLVILCTILLANLIAIAQTQQGYVRTLGRPEKAGEPLGEVNIKVKGQHNTVNSGSDGTFQMVLDGLHNGDAFSLSQVRKNGYELNETDLIGRPLAFSDIVRLEIVMVSSAQLQADKRRIENNAYKTAEKNYKAQYDLLEKQLNDNAISIEQYREQIQGLQDKFEKYQSLIDGLAEHYAHTDYDLLDEKDREINLCIENGELERADSLIRLLFDPIGVLERNVEALERLDQQISQAGEDLAQANADMEAVLKQQEKDAEYLYQLYTIALARYDNEKAQFYIETRAELDTTNPRWQTDAAYYLATHFSNEQAEKLFIRALNLYRKMDKSNLAGYGTAMALTLNNLAELYFDTSRGDKCEDLFLEALDICNRLLETENTRALGPKVFILSNLGQFYAYHNRFSEAAEKYTELQELFAQQGSTHEDPEMQSKAMISMVQTIITMVEKGNYMNQKIAEAFLSNINEEWLENAITDAEDDYVTYGPAVIQLIESIANLYAWTNKTEKYEALLVQKLELSRKLSSADSKAYTPTLIYSILDLASYYSQTQRFSESEPLYHEALALGRQLTSENKGVFDSVLKDVLNGISTYYSIIGYQNNDIESLFQSERFLNESSEIIHRLHEIEPQRYSRSLFDNLLTLGDLRNLLGDVTNEDYHYKNAESSYKEAVEVGHYLAENNPQFYEQDLVDALNSLAILYSTMANLEQDSSYYPKSENLFIEAIEIGHRLGEDELREYRPGLASSLINYGFMLYNWGHFEQCGAMFEEGIQLWRSMISEGHNEYELSLAEALTSYAQSEQMCGQHQKGISKAEEAKEICLRHLDEAQDLYITTLVSLGNLYVRAESYEKAYETYDELHPLLKSRFQERQERMPGDYIIQLGNESYSCIFVKKFSKAEQLSREALNIDITQKWLFTNLATALLLQGKYEEAEEIYLYLKPELLDDMLNDLDLFEKAGVIPKDRMADVERIRKLLVE